MSNINEENINEASIDDFCRNAIREGFIYKDALCTVLGWDLQYHQKLSELWQRFEMHKRHNHLKTETETNRTVAWFRLITRMTTGTIAGPHSAVNPFYPFSYLKTYHFNEKNSNLESKKDNPGGYIKLDELEDYFNKHEIPLPSKLFPNQKAKITNLPKDHIAKRHQQTREQCREITREILKKRPDSMINDVIFDDRISTAATKDKNGKMYGEGAIRNWIKDLFPKEARKPGRRPKN